jgi:hypothetical protein
MKNKVDPKVGWDKKQFKNMMIGVAFIPILGWAIGLTSGFKGGKLAKQAWTLFLISTVTAIIYLNIFGGIGSVDPNEAKSFDDPYIETVYNGYFEGYEEKKVGRVFESYFSDVTWKRIKSDISWQSVWMIGTAKYDGQKEKITVVFSVSPDNKTFELDGATIKNMTIWPKQVMEIFDKAY